MQETSPNIVIPFPGPRPYTEAFAHWFFGRERELDRAIDYATRQRLSVLTAASSCGKTSLLQAGLIPRLRFMRVDAIASGDTEGLTGFPLLLNQWLGRVGAERTGDFAKLVTVECHRYLTSALPWYETLSLSLDEDEKSRAAASTELDAVRAAAEAVAALAVDSGFAQVVDRDGIKSLLMDSDVCRRHVEDSETTDLLLKLFSCVTAPLGTVIVILDQFEEILNDAALGRQAILAVESTYKLQGATVGQMISMREDSSHLLRPLVERGTLGDKRMQSIQPLSPESVQSVVTQVADDLGIAADVDAVSRLVRAFTDTSEVGSGKRDVNLLGLQVVLQSLFSGMERGSSLDVAAIKAFCAEMAGVETLSAAGLDEWLEPHLEADRVTGGDVVARARLAQEAPKRWISSSLGAGKTNGADSALPDEIDDLDYVEALVQPMVARMATWLVTPSGFKRPMTFGELQLISYDAPRDRDDLSGQALIGEGWSLARVESVLKNTFRVALFRLADVGHILKIRGTDQDASYELVHDQFGKPLQSWAEEFRATPEANIGALYATDDIAFPWGRNDTTSPRTMLAPSVETVDEDGVPVLEWTKWRGCTIHGVDFSGLTLRHCDLSRTLFVDCVFDSATKFVDCELIAALFRDCSMSGTRLEGCDLDSAAISSGCVFDGVTIEGGSFRFAEARGAILRDCRFEGTPGAPLAMRNILLVNCSLEGTTEFTECSLDGATIGTEAERGDTDQDAVMLTPGHVSFERCDLKGAELSSMDFGAHSMTLVDTIARGAVFTELTFDRRDRGEVAVRFDDVDLTGAVFIGCELRHASFTGVERARQGTKPSLTPCRTLVMKSVPGLPMVLDDARFAHLDMENFSFENCVVEDPITFAHCSLAGGTISADAETVPAAPALQGTLTFEEDCDLTALEFNGLDFSDSALVVRDSVAASIYFEGVTLPVAAAGAWRAEFAGCVMPGALFMSCDVHGLWIHGTDARPVAIAPTLIVRGDGDGDTFGHCRFENANLENFTFAGVVVDGQLDFISCALSGGTIAGDQADPDAGQLRSALRISAPLRFTGGSELAAVEFNTVLFDGGELIVADSSCDGMLFLDVDAKAATNEPVIRFERTSLAGAVILGSRIHGLRATGAVADGRMTSGWGLTIRSLGKFETTLGDADFEGLDLAGLVLQGVGLTGPVRFRRCSLLRSRFAGIIGGTADSTVDVYESDLLYSDIDDALRGARPDDDEVTPGRLLRMKGGQWDAASKAAEGRKHLAHEA